MIGISATVIVIVQNNGVLITWAWTVGISVALTIISTASVVVRLASSDVNKTKVSIPRQ